MRLRRRGLGGTTGKIACRVESICAPDDHDAMVRISRDLVRYQN